MASVVDVIQSNGTFLVCELHDNGVCGLRYETDDPHEARRLAETYAAEHGLRVDIVSGAAIDSLYPGGDYVS